MTAATFLSGQEANRAPEPPLVSGPRLSIADGVRLLRTPSSEFGIQAYHRAFEGAAADPETLLAELAALREGRTTRFELLAQIARAPKARARGAEGPGLLLIRVVSKAFVVSGAAARIRGRRALIARTQDARLTAAGTLPEPAHLARKLVVLEGALLKLEHRMFVQAQDSGDDRLAALGARVEALEAELKRRLLDPP